MARRPNTRPRSTMFTTWLRERMGAIGLSQTELSKKAGLKQAQLSYFLNGRRRPQSEHLRSIAAALNLPLEEALLVASDLQLPGVGLLIGTALDKANETLTYTASHGGTAPESPTGSTSHQRRARVDATTTKPPEIAELVSREVQAIFGHDEARRAQAYAMLFQYRPEMAVFYLDRARRDSSPLVKVMAAKLLGYCEAILPEQSIMWLQQLLRDKSAAVRKEAIRSLAGLNALKRSDDVRHAVHRLRDRDPDAKVRQAAVDADTGAIFREDLDSGEFLREIRACEHALEVKDASDDGRVLQRCFCPSSRKEVKWIALAALQHLPVPKED